MAEYIYTTEAHAADATDFVTNYKSSALEITQITIAQTAFTITKTYTDFKALVATPIDWGDVKFIQVRDNYELYLVSESEL